MHEFCPTARLRLSTRPGEAIVPIAVSGGEKYRRAGSRADGQLSKATPGQNRTSSILPGDDADGAAADNGGDGGDVSGW